MPHLKRASTLLLLPLIALMTAGWKTPLRPPTEGMAGETLAGDSRYMDARFNEKRAEGSDEAMPIDLADPAQHRFVMNRLRASGKTPENSPHLFQRLNAARQRALARAANPSAREGAMVESEWGCQHMMTVAGQTTAGMHDMVSRTQATCVSGASYVYVDMVAYDADAADTQRTAVAANSAEEYAGGTDFDVHVAPRVAAQASRQFIADSLMIAMDEYTGQEVTTYSVVKTSSAGTMPSISRSQAQVASALATIDTVDHPRFAGTPGPAITSCQLRGESDCDYALVQNTGGVLTPWTSAPQGLALRQSDNPWRGNLNEYFTFPAGYTHTTDRVYLPMQFRFDAGTGQSGRDCIIKKVLDGTRGRLTKTIQGGACVTHEQGGTAAGDLKTAVNALLNQRAGTVRQLIVLPTQTVGLQDGQTGVVVDCSMSPIRNDTTRLFVTVSVEADCGNGPERKTVTYPRASASTPASSLFIRNSCMAEGTKVQLADGGTVPVEQVRPGDKVVANRNGQVLTVTDVAHGIEDQPLVRLRDSLGHDVRLTKEHPVVLASGKVVAAEKVAVKDRVRTRKGVSSITAVERVPYEGQVYNLRLGTQAELASVDANGRTLFADGFLVGDSSMQEELNRAKHDTRELLVRLPKAWHKDYLARAAARK